MKRIFTLMAVALVLLLFAVMSPSCASLERAGKDIKSDITGGLERTVTVYNADGKVLKTYKGKIDLASTEGGIVKFDLNGQRIMYYNCYVEVIEESEDCEADMRGEKEICIHRSSWQLSRC